MSLQSATGSLREAANEQQPLALAPPPPGSAAAPGWHPASLGARIPPPTARRLRTRDQARPLGPRQHRGAEGKADSGGAVGSRRSRGEWAGLEQSGHALEASLCPPGGEGAGAAGRGGRGFQRALSTLPPASLHLSLLSPSCLSPSLSLHLSLLSLHLHQPPSFCPGSLPHPVCRTQLLLSFTWYRGPHGRITGRTQKLFCPGVAGNHIHTRTHT